MGFSLRFSIIIRIGETDINYLTFIDRMSDLKKSSFNKILTPSIIELLVRPFTFKVNEASTNVPDSKLLKQTSAGGATKNLYHCIFNSFIFYSDSIISRYYRIKGILKNSQNIILPLVRWSWRELAACSELAEAHR